VTHTAVGRRHVVAAVQGCHHVQRRRGRVWRGAGPGDGDAGDALPVYHVEAHVRRRAAYRLLWGLGCVRRTSSPIASTPVLLSFSLLSSRRGARRKSTNHGTSYTTRQTLWWFSMRFGLCFCIARPLIPGADKPPSRSSLISVSPSTSVPSLPSRRPPEVPAAKARTMAHLIPPDRRSGGLACALACAFASRGLVSRVLMNAR
jgi:hypothetical protein